MSGFQRHKEWEYVWAEKEWESSSWVNTDRNHSEEGGWPAERLWGKDTRGMFGETGREPAGQAQEMEKNNGRRQGQRDDAKLDCTRPHRPCRGKILNIGMDLEGSFCLTYAKRQKGKTLRMNGCNGWKRMRTEMWSMGHVLRGGQILVNISKMEPPEWANLSSGMQRSVCHRGPLIWPRLSDISLHLQDKIQNWRICWISFISDNLIVCS